MAHMSWGRDGFFRMITRAGRRISRSRQSAAETFYCLSMLEERLLWTSKRIPAN
jgi:hypothetical protein